MKNNKDEIYIYFNYIYLLMPDSTTLLLLTAAALTAGGIYMLRSQNSEIKPEDKPLQEIVFKPPPAPAVPGVLNIQPNRHLLFGMQMDQSSSQPDNSLKAKAPPFGHIFSSGKSFLGW